MDSRTADWTPGLGDASTVLVRPDDDLRPERIRAALLEETPASQAVIVSYEQSVEDWLSTRQGAEMESVAFLSVGEAVRSSAATTPTATAHSAPPMEATTVDGVADPTDLTALGLTIHQHLQEPQSAGGGGRILCLDSLTAVVEAGSVRRAFRFLHVLTRVVDSCGATAYYHADAALATEDFETLRVLFDAELHTHGSPDTSTWTLQPNSPRLIDGESS